MVNCTVKIDLSEILGTDTLTGPVSSGASVQIHPNRPRNHGDTSILTANSIRVRFDADGVLEIPLPPDDPDSASVFRFRGFDGASLISAWVQIPDVGTVNYRDLLPGVDPDSFDPLVEPVAAWTTALNNEVARAGQREDDIDDRVAAEETARSEGDAANASDIADEIERATEAEATNAQDITDEVLRAQGVEAGLQAALDDKADLVDGLVPSSQIPAIALGTGQAVANRAAMLALTDVQPGDFVSITSTADKGTYILNDADPTVFGHWMPLSVPTDVVQSVNGQNGVIVLGKGDVGLGSVDNTPDSGKPVSGPQAAAIAVNTAAIASEAGARAAADLAFVQLVQWARNPDQLIAGTITRDSNDAATSAPVVWPDGTPGTYTALNLSTDFPGAVDGYRVTYGSPVTKTFTQPAVTRNATGAVTSLPAIVVT